MRNDGKNEMEGGSDERGGAAAAVAVAEVGSGTAAAVEAQAMS